MIKPPSITRFEQLYWASVILGLINTGLNWSAAQQALAANPLLANARWFLPLTTVMGIAISVSVWFFIVRQPSVIAKWAQVAFAALSFFSLLSTLFVLVGGRGEFGAAVVIGVVSNLLYIAAAVLLFRGDARAWLGEGLDADDREPLA